MSMIDWAEQECRIACKRENPNFDFDNPNHYKYNTFSIRQSLCTQNDDPEYKCVPELVEISGFLRKIREDLLKG